MRKRLSVLCLVLIAALMCPMTTFAQAQTQPAPDTADVYAVVDLSEGGELIVDDAPDTSLMEDAESYELYLENEPVLSVEHILAGARSAAQAPQFYSVDFTFPDSEVEVFLTGLMAENVEEIQQTILKSFARGKSFEMTDLGFIDAEKTAQQDGDDDLCWAASASDMLVYTGWAAQAGFENEDDMFEDFISSFTNDGGNHIFAMAWFFNGAHIGNRSGNYGAKIRDYPNSGAYLTDYAFDQVVGRGDFTVDQMDSVAELLRGGSGIGLSVEVSYNGQDGGGHAITMWGYTLDHSVPESDPGRYLNIFVTDSDSHERYNVDRRGAPNVMHSYALREENGQYAFDFSQGVTGSIYGYYVLPPYSEDFPRETNPDAPKDKQDHPDLMIGELYLSDTDQTQEQMTLLETEKKLYFGFSIDNYGDQSYFGNLHVNVKITAADGTVRFDRSMSYRNQSLPTQNYIEPTPFLYYPSLPSGDYVLTVSVNTDRGASGVAQEAYYYNNTSSLPFKVRDTYLLGDFDNSGRVEILDATGIQRRLADYTDSFGSKAEIRGDVDRDGLNILDATLIQRYLANYAVSMPVGEKYMYE